MQILKREKEHEMKTDHEERRNFELSAICVVPRASISDKFNGETMWFEFYTSL